jgi:hypothetical protein
LIADFTVSSCIISLSYGRIHFCLRKDTFMPSCGNSTPTKAGLGLEKVSDDRSKNKGAPCNCVCVSRGAFRHFAEWAIGAG